jgi:hypothetical protein
MFVDLSYINSWYVQMQQKQYEKYCTKRNALNHPEEAFIFTLALGSTQPLTEMSTRNLPGG